MVDRLILGERNSGEFGLWISKPGVSVWTASGNDLLFDMTRTHVQAVQTGLITLPTGVWVNVVCPNLGYKPFCLGYVTSVNGLDYYYPVKFRCNSNTSIDFQYVREPSSGAASVSYRYCIMAGAQHD